MTSLSVEAAPELKSIEGIMSHLLEVIELAGLDKKVLSGSFLV
jgi:hypothetical protein